MEWLVSKIGLKLAELLLNKLQLAIVHVYESELIKRTQENITQMQKERNAIIKSISKADTNDERRTLSIMLSKLSNNDS